MSTSNGDGRQSVVVKSSKEQGHHHNGDQAARRSHILCSICVQSFGALAKAVQRFIASLHTQKTDALSNVLYRHFRQIRTVWLRFERDTFLPPLWGLGETWGSGWAYSIARPWVPISSTLTHMVYLLPFSSYIAGSKSVSVSPSDLETMTNTASDAASSSGKNCLPNELQFSRRGSSMIFESSTLTVKVYNDIKSNNQWNSIVK